MMSLVERYTLCAHLTEYNDQEPFIFRTRSEIVDCVRVREDKEEQEMGTGEEIIQTEHHSTSAKSATPPTSVPTDKEIILPDHRSLSPKSPPPRTPATPPGMVPGPVPRAASDPVPPATSGPVHPAASGLAPPTPFAPPGMVPVPVSLAASGPVSPTSNPAPTASSPRASPTPPSCPATPLAPAAFSPPAPSPHPPSPVPPHSAALDSADPTEEVSATPDTVMDRAERVTRKRTRQERSNELEDLHPATRARKAEPEVTARATRAATKAQSSKAQSIRGRGAVKGSSGGTRLKRR